MTTTWMVTIKQKDMKANELRIGNWIECLIDDDVNVETTVTHLPCGVGLDYEIGTHITDDRFIDENFEVQPIKLTEEWLKRFNWNPPKDIGVSFSLTTDEIHFVAGNYYKKIEHVHQLQNLYFALTGEELNQNKDE